MTDQEQREQTAPKLGCNYHGQMFGASYPDACCIDGYLWDEDSCDEPGGDLVGGGEIPCPNCNAEEAAERIAESQFAESEGDETVESLMPAARERVAAHVARMREKWGFFGDKLVNQSTRP